MENDIPIMHMDWLKVSTESKSTYRKFKKWYGGYSNDYEPTEECLIIHRDGVGEKFQERNLYDFFDKEGAIITVDEDDEKWGYDIKIGKRHYDDGKGLYDHATRTSCENEAFEWTFRLLEKK